MELLFWIAAALIFYIYFGYGALVWFVLKGKSFFKKEESTKHVGLPAVTLVIPAFNEEEYIDAKIKNSLALDYPKDKLEIIVITDGSTDNTAARARKFAEVTTLHKHERGGKAAAMNRAMSFVTTPIVAFSDANTLLNPEAMVHLTSPFADKLVGAVAGEKRVIAGEQANAAGQGEGLYWKYESALKRMDAELYSVVGAAGELFAVRTDLYVEVESDTILDDFMLSLRVNEQGFRVMYAPEAFAMETGSANIEEEWKRKVRICAGGFQSISRLTSLLNPFKHGVLTFQYLSHRVFRWTLAPLLLVGLFGLNLILAPSHFLYVMLLLCQVAFYTAALHGWQERNHDTRNRWTLVPLYFTMMHLAAFAGFVRFITKSQSANWEKAKRAETLMGQAPANSVAELAS